MIRRSILFLSVFVLFLSPGPGGRSHAEEGNVERGIRGNALALPFYLPETGFGAGGAVALSYRPKDSPAEIRPDSIAAGFVYTQKHQLALLILPDVYWGEQKWELTGEYGYSYYPNSFYGIGNNTRNEDRERFTTEGVYIQPLVVRKSWRNLRAGFAGDITWTDVEDKEAGGILDRDAVPGSDGGLRVGIGPYLDWDSRDHAFCPSSGWWVRLSALSYPAWMGSDFDYDMYTADVRGYRTLRPSHVIAFQFLGMFSRGEVYFDEMPVIGLRGIFENRFMDRNSIMAQAEYRFPIRGRFSGVAFFGIGDVAEHPAAFWWEDFTFAGGGGIRFALIPEEKINIRFDLGASPYGIYPYLHALEVF